MMFGKNKDEKNDDAKIMSLTPTAYTLSAISEVLGFDIIELWTPNESGELYCFDYFHAESVKRLIKKLYADSAQFTPNSLESWSGNSIRMCEGAKRSDTNYVWAYSNHRNLSIPLGKRQEAVTLPVQTEVSHAVPTECDLESFVVCYTRARIDVSAAKIKYMACVCEAALISSTNFHDSEVDDAELDNKIFKPRDLTAYGSTLDLADMDKDEAVEMGCWSSHHSRAGGTMENLLIGDDGAVLECGIPPTWEPVDAHSFPVAEIPAAADIPDNLAFDAFQDIKHLADGSNSNVYLARYRGQQVVVKMISEKAKTNKVAVHEFDVEHGMLARMRHPHIVRLIGAGRMPRRFIVLEHLGGGCLNSVLGERDRKKGLSQKLFKKSTFSYEGLLAMARDIAAAFYYLHNNVHEGAMVIHRDIKPDNIGFTSSGEVKLFDFGLCTCVRKRTTTDEAYEMTGNTGSLRYMAPEVALRLRYNEKADVYSFGILLWQMAKDKVPFKGMNRTEFMSRVARKGERPKIDKSWSPDFVQLLEACWHVDHEQRPSFEMVSHVLTRLLMTADGGGKSNRTNSMSNGQGNDRNQSTWF